MPPLSTIARMVAVSALVALTPRAAFAVSEPPPDPIRLGLYEWMGVAPVVIAAHIIADDAKFVVAIATTPIKGGFSAGDSFAIDLRQANRDRDPGAPALDLVKGKAYLLLLRASTRGQGASRPVFALERGVRGARELPLEGSAATIDAAVRLAAIQERKSDELLWATLPDLLEDTNPVLVDGVLDLYVKFRREDAALIPVLAPLLDDPRPDFRRRTALLLGRVLQRAGSGTVPERPSIIAALTGRARRDDDATVRREATAALAALPDAGIEETLLAIARDDPDQNVRFEAVKAGFTRKQADAPKRSD